MAESDNRTTKENNSHKNQFENKIVSQSIRTLAKIWSQQINPNYAALGGRNEMVF